MIVCALFCRQCVVIASLYDFAFVKDNDLVSIPYRT